MDECAWNDNSSKILLNNKDATLVLRLLKRIQQNINDEAEVLNEFEELGGNVHFQIKRLYTEGQNSWGRSLSIVKRKVFVSLSSDRTPVQSGD